MLYSSERAGYNRAGCSPVMLGQIKGSPEMGVIPCSLFNNFDGILYQIDFKITL